LRCLPINRGLVCRKGRTYRHIVLALRVSDKMNSGRHVCC
jgi:hypothetical protein